MHNDTDDSPRIAELSKNATIFDLKNLTDTGGAVYAIVSEKEVTAFFIISDEPNSSVIYLTKIDEIKSSLDAYYRLNKYSLELMPELEGIHENMRQLSRTHESGEAECRRLAGTDNHQCNSFETCRLACFATPFCPNFVYGGRPGEFVYVIWSFENDSNDLASAYAEEEMTFDRLKLNASPRNFERYLDAIKQINIAATKVNFNGLFTYSFCNKPDYSLSNVTIMQLAAQDRIENSSPFSAINEEAEKIRKRTEKMMEQQEEAERAAYAKDMISRVQMRALAENFTEQKIGALEDAHDAQPYDSEEEPRADLKIILIMLGTIFVLGMVAALWMENAGKKKKHCRAGRRMRRRD